MEGGGRLEEKMDKGCHKREGNGYGDVGREKRMKRRRIVVMIIENNED